MVFRKLLTPSMQTPSHVLHTIPSLLALKGSVEVKGEKFPSITHSSQSSPHNFSLGSSNFSPLLSPQTSSPRHLASLPALLAKQLIDGLEGLKK